MADTVWMDKEKMRRAFINLLGNAIRYAKSQVLIKSFFEDGHAVIEIKDDGPGIAAEEEKKIFQRFYSGEAGGSGMGLAITKAIIEGHGGTITASNAESGGAVFKIVIPG
ncbi:HAMP domain-containing sensor histidine kinase [Neobacillus sp. PS3-34]|uniref:sensor histidine kinase n=1 Tax=Neobacillus sp. PS3-34 TaxID=3070678 RepID=UPI0027DF194B|nr:HAMP domain-containing sensor histidine kinase [Neobacillus sp. PS3-34]WML46813.1 HAMP domain-containing sensor histidine kinase [Neobacillus sp. PS3-34]